MLISPRTALKRALDCLRNPKPDIITSVLDEPYLGLISNTMGSSIYSKCVKPDSISLSVVPICTFAFPEKLEGGVMHNAYDEVTVDGKLHRPLIKHNKDFEDWSRFRPITLTDVPPCKGPESGVIETPPRDCITGMAVKLMGSSVVELPSGLTTPRKSLPGAWGGKVHSSSVDDTKRD